MDFLFKGDEMPLLAMEHGELISIVTANGGYPFGQVNPVMLKSGLQVGLPQYDLENQF